jgi:adenylosuccinate synthase
MAHVIITSGMGYGDSCKGASVHHLTRHLGAKTVIKYGGGHGGHTVLTPDGATIRHSHFSSGTLAGADTFLSRKMVVVPSRLAEELVELEALGVPVWDKLTVDEGAIISTHWHIEANRFKELARGTGEKQGTSGKGVGEAIRDTQAGLGLKVKDLRRPDLREVLEEIRRRKQDEMSEIVQRLDAEDPTLADAEWRSYPGIMDDVCELYRVLGKRLRIVDGREHLAKLVEQDGYIICQSSQGAGISRRCGFYPYTTSAGITPDVPRRLLAEVGFSGKIDQLGLIRAYLIRHGAGPFVTEDSGLTRLITDPNNGYNQWQGGFRIGYMDTLLLRYTIAACGGSDAFSGLAVNCLDHLPMMPKWQICTAYTCSWPDREELERFFVTDGNTITDIRVHPDNGTQEHLDYQQRLGELLTHCIPQYEQIVRGSAERYIQRMEALLGVLVVITAIGPKEADRKIRRDIWAKP